MNRKGKLRDYVKSIIEESQKKSNTYQDNTIYCEYNEEISEKFYKILEVMLQIPFDFSDENGKLTLTFNSSSEKDISSSEEGEYFQIVITNSKFKIIRNFSDILGFRDNLIYSLFSEKIKLAFQKRKAELFHSIMEDMLSVFPSVGRECKLQQILN